MNDKFNAFVVELLTAEQSMFQKATGLLDWTYRDLPRMTREDVGSLIDIIGPDNIHWITMADYGDAVRGQVMISPAGMDNIRVNLAQEHQS